MPKVSVIIPIFNTQNQLKQCLDSIVSQTLQDIEIIIVDDGSETKPTVKDVIKKNFKKDKRIKYVHHSVNEGLIESRRTGVLESCGEYIFFIDTDDKLNKENALEVMYDIANCENADIVQCSAFVDIVQESFDETKYYEKAASPHLGELCGIDIFRNCYFDAKHPWYIWGKLLKRNVCTVAFDFIPDTYCVMAEDFLLYFFISRNSKKYVGIPDKFYCYKVGEGISTDNKITSLDKWKSHCSSASVFTVIFLYNRENPLDEETYKMIVAFAQTAVIRSVMRLENSVLPELKYAAREMLCDAWGRTMVEKAEEFCRKNKTEDKSFDK